MPRYQQTHHQQPNPDFVIARDESQFHFYAQSHESHSYSPQSSSQSSHIWHKYKGTPSSMENTFQHIFHKYKKGIYVRIQNGKVDTFLPFNKHDYVNEWSDRVVFTETPFSRASTLIGYKFNPYTVNEPHRWYANNGIFRYEYPPQNSVHDDDSVMLSMLSELCASYPSSHPPSSIPDVQFFLNRRDNPLLRRDDCEAYDAIYGEKEPLLSHNYDSYLPVLSMCTGDKFADIPIPTWEDWNRTSTLMTDPTVNWNDRLSTALFRGSSTGYGVSKETNVRLKVLEIMQTQPMIDGEPPLLDAGITKWNCRPRIQNGQVVNFSPKDISRPCPFMTRAEQMKFKYILHVQGHVCAFRLASDLSLGSVVLFVPSSTHLWFTPLLVPYVHYVPVKPDLSDLLSQIEWCRAHDKECQEIAQNATQFYFDHLTRSKMMGYMRNTLIEIASHLGSYSNRPILRVISPIKFLLPQIESMHSLSETMNVVNDTMLCKTHSTELDANNECVIGMILNEFNDQRVSETYGRTGECSVCVEYTPSVISLEDYICKNNVFSLTTVLEILSCVSKLLDELDEFCGFEWNDAFPWRVLLMPNRNIRIINYTYSKVNSQRRDKLKDIRCLVASTMHLVLQKRRLDKRELSTVFRIVNALSGQAPIRSISDLKLYLHLNKDGFEFSHLIDSVSLQ